MALDLGDLLGMRLAESSAPEAGPRISLHPQGADPWVFAPLLRLLVSRGMAACLRQALAALGEPAPPGAESSDRGAAADVADLPSLEATVERLLAPAALTMHAAGSTALAAGGAVAAAEGGRLEVAGVEQQAPSQAAPPASTPATHRCTIKPRASSPMAAAVVWWLWRLLFGFKPPPLERTYQAFKAAECLYLDRLALFLEIGMRASLTLRTYRDRVMTASPPPGWWLQWASNFVYLLPVAVFALGLAVVPSLHVRNRNAMLLLRAMLDAAVLLLMFCPLPWVGRSLLVVPDMWRTACQHCPLHWITMCVMAPALVQLSPYMQGLATLALLAPMFLFGRLYGSGRWHSGALFAVAFVVSTLGISAATDFFTRRRFLAQRQRQPESSRPLGGSAAAGNGAVSSSSGQGDGIRKGKVGKAGGAD